MVTPGQCPARLYAGASDDSPRERLRRILRVHDIAHDAANQGDAERARQAIELLRHAIGPDMPPHIALSLHGIYTNLERDLDSGNFRAVGETCLHLKSLWHSLFP